MTPLTITITIATALRRLQADVLLRAVAHGRDHRPDSDEAGQATAEYALVLLGAAAVALLVVAWATKTNTVGRLLDAVFGHLLAKSTGK